MRAHLAFSVLVACVASAGLFTPTVSRAQDGGGRAPEAAPPAPPPANVDEAVSRVQKFYDQSTTFQSDFVQEFVVKAYKATKSSAGTVTFSKPGRMDWVYTNPKDNRVVSDGSELKVYDAANKQLYQQQVDKSQYPAALAFLTGQGKLADHFNFELHQGAAANFSGGFVLAGTPKQPHPAYSKVFFYVDAATSQVRRVLIVDGQGNKNRFDFTTPRVNLPVSEQRFKFTPPAGTTVVKP